MQLFQAELRRQLRMQLKIIRILFQRLFNMDYIVEFLETGGARVIKDPVIIEKKKDAPNVLLNPELRHLQGISPSFWILKDGVISAHSLETAKQIVVDQFEAINGFEVSNQAPFSNTSKYFFKLDEIDAKQNEQIRGLNEKFSNTKDDIYSKLEDLQLDLEEQNQLQKAEIRSMRMMGILMYLSLMLTMLLIKFL